MNDNYIKSISSIYKDATNALYLGRREICSQWLQKVLLKLKKEISYIHTEGYPAAEMKHGPIALIDQNMPVFVWQLRDKSYEKIVSNIQSKKQGTDKLLPLSQKVIL